VHIKTATNLRANRRSAKNAFFAHCSRFKLENIKDILNNAPKLHIKWFFLFWCFSVAES